MVTAEMIDLFRRGSELVAAGLEHSSEFKKITKELHWTHLGEVSGSASVFDDEAEPPRHYLAAHFAGQLREWETIKAWREALLAAVDENKDRACT
jgi:hypothetical protein